MITVRVELTMLATGQTVTQTETTAPDITDIDEYLDACYERMDLAGWAVTDHRETTGETILEATTDLAYCRIDMATLTS